MARQRWWAVAGLVLLVAAFGIPGLTSPSETMFVEVVYAEGCSNNLGDSENDGDTKPCSDGGNVNQVAPPRTKTCDGGFWRGLWRNIVWIVTGRYSC